MIMGPHTGYSMLLGAVIGWGILGYFLYYTYTNQVIRPVAKIMNWAPG